MCHRQVRWSPNGETQKSVSVLLAKCAMPETEVESCEKWGLCTMNTAERQEKIATFANGYDFLREAITHFPKEMWNYKASPDSWSIHAIIIHITDSEVNSYVRCRRFIAEPGSTVMGYNETVWE